MPRLAAAFLVFPIALAAAEPPDKPFVPDEHTTLLCHFENAGSVTDPAWIAAGHGRIEGEATFVKGRFGKALLLDERVSVRLPGTPGTMPVAVGTFEAMLRPSGPWPGWSTLLLRNGTVWDKWGRNQFDLHFEGGDHLEFRIGGRTKGMKVRGKLPEWKPGSWRHVAVCWDLRAGKAAIYVDGKQIAKTQGDPIRMDPAQRGFTLNMTAGRKPLNAAIDELRISNVWRPPGSDNYRAKAVQPPPAESPLNADPGFERADPAAVGQSRDAAWHVAELPKGAVVRRIAKGARSGDWAVALNQPLPRNDKTVLSARPFWIPAEPGRTYTFTAWLRSDEPNVEARLVLVTDAYHSRQVVLKPAGRWTRHEVVWRIPEDGGNLIWPRIENWGGGTLYVDDARLVEGGTAPGPGPLVVDAGAVRGPRPHLHDGVDVALINWQSATLDARSLELLGRLGIRRVRYSIFCPALGLSPAEDQWDWTLVDRHLSMFAAAGIEPILVFHFTPKWLAREGKRHGVPTDYALWGRLVRNVVHHINVERKLGVRYFEVWNEPDLDFWTGTTDDFCRLYKTFAEAVRSVDPTAKVGGPGVSGGHKGWRGHKLYPLVRRFIDSVGRNDLPLDFFSYHVYAMQPAQAKAQAEEFRGLLASWPKLRDAELLVTEWNQAAGPKGVDLDGAENAAYAAAMLDAMAAGSVDQAFFFNFKDPAWKHPGRIFFNDLGLVTVDATPKAVANTMRLASRLGPTRLRTSGGDWRVGAMAATGPNGPAVLVYNATGQDRSRDLRWVNLPARPRRLRRTRIDRTHSNALDDFRSRKPAKPRPLPPLAKGRWSKTLRAADLAGTGEGNWHDWPAAHRVKAPAGANDRIAATRRAGPELAWTAELPDPGAYRIWAKVDCNYYGGVLELVQADRTVGSVETYIAGIDMRWVRWAIPACPAGPNRFALRLARSGGLLNHPRRGAAVDTIVMTNDATWRPWPVRTGTEGQAGVDLRAAAELEVIEQRDLPAGEELELRLELPAHSVELIELLPRGPAAGEATSNQSAR
jgi:hypothetical protein